MFSWIQVSLSIDTDTDIDMQIKYPCCRIISPYFEHTPFVSATVLLPLFELSMYPDTASLSSGTVVKDQRQVLALL